MDETKAKILVSCHKPDVWKSDDVYLPVQGGKEISNYELGIQGDNEGENISEKNKAYCELTTIFWAWKNLPRVDYIGLCHYRRYFNFNNEGSAFHDFTPIKTMDFDKLNLTVPNFKRLFKKYDIILAKPKVYPVTVFTGYCLAHHSEDVKILEKLLKEKYPELSQSIKKIFHNYNKVSHYNMFIMSWDNFDKYCSWLFEVIEEAEKRIDISCHSETQKRIWGYMSERLLLLLFVNHHNMRVKYYPVYYINDDVKLKSVLHRFQRYVRKSLSFAIMKSINNL